MDTRDVIETADGSHTLFSHQFNEIYHSRHGAIQESQHVFIKEGLDYLKKQNNPDQPIRLFEVGFGTGLNALLSILYAENSHVKIRYTTTELYPVSIDTIKQLNYTSLLGFEFCYGPYHTMHLCIRDTYHQITENFEFCFLHADVNNVAVPKSDIIYFDAFAPTHQPDLWTKSVFEKLYESLEPKGIMVTYCSKSIVQRAMKDAGFKIEKIPGPPGKREMIRAIRL